MDTRIVNALKTLNAKSKSAAVTASQIGEVAGMTAGEVFAAISPLDVQFGEIEEVIGNVKGPDGKFETRYFRFM